MTRLRQIALGGAAAALLMTGAVSSGYAEESGTFQNRLNGATIGIPLGGAAPPGIYSGIETVYLGGFGNGNMGTCGGTLAPACGGQGNQLFLPAIAQAVPILWSTGWNVLGASYSMSLVQAFYEGNVFTGSFTNDSVVAGGPLGAFIVMANTTWNPIALSWNLGGGSFVSAGFNFMAPDGSHWTGTPNPDYWTFEPTLAYAYFGNNWTIAINGFYDINTASKGTCCGPGGATLDPNNAILKAFGFGAFLPALAATGAAAGNGFVSGQTLYIDASATYKVGKWSLGPVAYIETQTTSDSPGGGIPCSGTNTVGGVTVTIGGATGICGRYLSVGLGGMIGYDFGPVDLQVWMTDSVRHENAIDGAIIWTRLGFKVWGPEAPAAKPLVSKN